MLTFQNTILNPGLLREVTAGKTERKRNAKKRQSYIKNQIDHSDRNSRYCAVRLYPSDVSVPYDPAFPAGRDEGEQQLYPGGIFALWDQRQDGAGVQQAIGIKVKTIAILLNYRILLLNQGNH